MEEGRIGVGRGDSEEGVVVVDVVDLVGVDGPRRGENVRGEQEKRRL